MPNLFPITPKEPKLGNLNSLQSQLTIKVDKGRLTNSAFKSYRKMPKIRIKNTAEYESIRKTVKMDPKVLKAGIARFLLSKVAKTLPKKLTENPFSKIIQLPQMMGLDAAGIYGKFNTGPPMFYWRRRKQTTWVPQSREQASCVFIDG